MPYSAVGKSLGRIEGPDKVTGRTKYTADVSLPGMIWGKVLRSPLPHARITNIDVGEAEKMPGVLAVLTARDLPETLTGRIVYDMPVLARDCVRFIGEKVAVVAAEDPAVAEDALALIEVDYEELPSVFDAEEAMKEGAPLLHPEYKSYQYAPEKFFSEIPNVHSHVNWTIGEIEKGFSRADHLFEHTFRTPAVHQGYLEPHASVVSIDPDGKVHVWTTNKMPVRAKELLADAVAIPREQIVVHPISMGADFGGKGSLMDAPLCYHLAEKTGRPVKMVMTYTEELMAGNPRHPTTVVLRTGITKDYKVVARQAKVVFNSGAYAAFKPVPFVNIPGASQAAGVYCTPHVQIDAYSVYTNSVPAGHMRAPGDPQVNFAVESSMDIIAEELGIDRLEFRRMNLLKDGDLVPEGPLEQVRIRETIDAAVQASNWSKPKPRPHVGRGLAASYRHIGVGEANARLSLEDGGRVKLETAIPETGTGAYTILRQVVAETLAIPIEQIRVEPGSSEIFRSDSGAGASRVTYVAGLAAQEVSQELIRQMCELSAEKLEVPADGVRFEAGCCRAVDDPDRCLSMSEIWDLSVERNQRLSSNRSVKRMEDPAVTAFTAQVVELEVDVETGQVSVLDVVTCHDVGTIINPLAHQGQIEGGLVQGLGFGLLEELLLEDGQVSTLHLGDYKLPNFRDIPPLKTVLIQEEIGPTPFQGKAIGESSITPVASAIANAVYDAVGVRFFELPVTAERIYRALKEKGR